MDVSSTDLRQGGSPGRFLRGMIMAMVALALATAACARLGDSAQGAREGGSTADGPALDGDEQPGAPDEEPGGDGGSVPGDPGDGNPGSGGGSDPGGAGDPGDPVDPPDPIKCDETPPADADPDTVVCHEVPPGDDPTDIPDPSPSHVEPRPGMSNVHPLGWENAFVHDDQRSVTVTFWNGVEPCYVLDHVEVEYGEKTVTITLFSGSDPEAGKDTACIEIAQYLAVSFTLDEDIDGRTIVDGTD